MNSTLIEKLNDSNFDFYFLAVDQFLDINLPQLKNFISLTPKKFDIKLDFKNSGKLLSNPKVIEFIKNNSANSGRKPAIIPFKPSAKIDLICRQNNWVLIGNNSGLNRLLEDKIKFYDLCSKNNLPLLPALIVPFNQVNYQLAKDKFGDKLVLQTHFGWAGNSSFVSSEWSDISQLIPLNTIVKISPFIKGYSLINNCCLTSNGLIQSPPGMQYTGIPQLTNNPLATVGRQWPSFTSNLINSQVRLITQNFSEILKELNYRGFFGLDFIVDDQNVYLIECNPRLTASFAFYTQLELNLGVTPLFLLHLAEFINLNFVEKDHFEIQITGSEITSKNKNGATIKKYSDFTAFSKSIQPISIESKIISKVL